MTKLAIALGMLLHLGRGASARGRAEKDEEAPPSGLRRRRGQVVRPPSREFTGLTGASVADDPRAFAERLDAVLSKDEVLGETRTCETYSMSFYNRNYNTPEIEEIVPYAGAAPYRAQQWGRHALQWKGYYWESLSAYRSYDAALAADLNWSAIPFPSTPFFTVLSNDDAILNDLEKAPPEYYGATAEVNGVPVPNNDGLYKIAPPLVPQVAANPPGTWMKDYATGPVNGAILAAIYMHLWKTPVYANAYNAYPNSNQKVGQIVMEKVRLCVDGPMKPHDACGWSDYASAIDPNPGPGYNCQTPNGNLSLDSVTFRFFPLELPYQGVFHTWLTPSITIPGGNWATSGYWGCAAGMTGSCVLVFDPPEEELEEGGLEALKKRAGAMEESVLLPVLDEKYELTGVKSGKDIEIPEGVKKDVPLTYRQEKKVGCGAAAPSGQAREKYEGGEGN